MLRNVNIEIMVNAGGRRDAKRPVGSLFDGFTR